LSYKNLLSGLIASGLNYKAKREGCGRFAEALGESLISEQRYADNVAAIAANMTLNCHIS
jgi:hypothetical protein